MQEFLKNERSVPAKRNVLERIKDYEEVYTKFKIGEAQTQSERCLQCGDPFCSHKCPLHNYIPQWLKAVAEKELSLAFNLSNEVSPFPEVLGRVCPHDVLCEGDCSLNDGHGAITIGAVETHINEEAFKQGMKPKFPGVTNDKKVAIIGSGPAGLSAATFLLRAGIGVSMYERAQRAGGLLTYGIPGFKLDKKIVERRVKMLKNAGLELHLGVEVGEDVTFEDLVKDHVAVFIGTGATKAKSANILHESAKGSYAAMEFLTNAQKKNFGESYNRELEVKDLKVVVIGGGDTAMDCVRTSLREGAKEVVCFYRRDAESMPGSKKEHMNAVEEGVHFEFYASPKEIIVDDNGKVVGVKMVKTKLGERNDSGRGSIEEIRGGEFRVDADMVIFALGFNTETPEFFAQNGIETNKWGEIVVDESRETTTSGVYAGGDCYRGADLVVTAAYDGREAAKSIIKSLG